MMNNTNINRKKKKHSQTREIWRRFKKNKTAMLGLCLLVLVVGIAVFADLIIPYEKAVTQDIASRLQGPGPAHFFGTDEVGRDLFARIVHGSRYSLTIGISTTLISILIGGFLGAVAAYYGGWVDNVIMRLTDVVMTVPPILLSLAVVAALGASLRNLLIAITVSCVPGIIRMVRSVVLGVVEEDYIEAARSYGASDMRIILKYVIPNALGPIIVTATMQIPSAIFTEAFMSFIGLGVSAPMASLGTMCNDALETLQIAPYQLAFPAGTICLAMFAFNFIGDGLRDAFDPQTRK